MTSRDDALIESGIDQLYMSLSDPVRLPAAIETLRRCFDATAASYFSATHAGEILDFAHSGHDADVQRRYVSYYSTIDPNRTGFLSARPGQWLADDSLLDAGKTPSAEYVNDFAKAAGLRYIRGGKVFEDERAIAFFSVQRPQDARPFGADTIALLERIHPHLRRISRLARELDDAFPRAATDDAVCESLAIAVCIVDSTARLRYQNRAADALLKTAANVRARHGRIVGGIPEVEARLRRAIALATTHPRQGSAFCSTVGDSAVGRLQVRVLPLAEAHALSRAGGDRFALLFLAAGPGPRRPEELRQLFGATASETGLIELLSAGLTPTECARQRGVSINTIRTQLAGLLAKTGTRSQAELISLVLSLPAMPVSGRDEERPVAPDSSASNGKPAPARR